MEHAIAVGARQIVQHCLGLEPNQQLVIFVDETTIEPGVAMAEAAECLGISQTVFLVPVSVQRRIPWRPRSELAGPEGRSRRAGHPHLR